MIYNTNLLNDSPQKKIEAQKFINNIILIVIDKFTRKDNGKLAKVHNSIYKDGKAKYGSKFNIFQYQFISINEK